MSIHEKPVFLSGLGFKEKTVEATTRWKYCLFFLTLVLTTCPRSMHKKIMFG